MRDGRRFEIPNDFIVSRITLTYEISSGFQRTLLLNSIDIVATERANNEPPGSLLKRATAQPASPTAQAQTTPGRRSITNRDLETFKQSRLASEAAYERRRKELGLPTVEETRRRAELEANLGRENLRTMRSKEAESEAYWRRRASELRAEIASTNARIDFVQARLNETQTDPAFDGFTTVLPFGLVGQSRFGRTGQRRFHQPSVFSAPGSAQLGGRVRVGAGNTRGRIFINPIHGRRGSRRFPLFAPPLFSNPFQTYDDSYERSELIVQLDELLADRAGLQARWRELEEEARRAGVYPGWLRP
jgi:hypothetical protein